MSRDRNKTIRCRKKYIRHQLQWRFIVKRATEDEVQLQRERLACSPLLWLETNPILGSLIQSSCVVQEMKLLWMRPSAKMDSCIWFSKLWLQLYNFNLWTLNRCKTWKVSFALEKEEKKKLNKSFEVKATQNMWHTITTRCLIQNFIG